MYTSYVLTNRLFDYQNNDIVVVSTLVTWTINEYKCYIEFEKKKMIKYSNVYKNK